MKKAVLLAIALVMAFSASAFALGTIKVEDQKPAFIYVGPAADGGYNYMHDQGRKLMEKNNPGLKSSIVESVPEGPDAERVMETAIRNGAKVIYANSFGYMDHVINVAKRHPDVYFNHCSGYKDAPNVSTYFGRMYQPRYLSGLVAGRATKSNNIGYVAAYPIPEVIRGINAFTLGVRKVNPKAKVKVVWIYTWHDPAKEKEATKALFDAKCDTVAMHADTGGAPKAAEELGMWVIGYNTPMDKYAPTRHLVTPVWNWGKYYDYSTKAIAKGTWKSQQVWWSMKDGMVDLSNFGKAVSEDTKKLVAAEKKKILDGKWDVFHGPIKGQDGKTMVAAGQKLTDKDMLSMNKFVEGVDGTIPK
ncbi:MAG: BMP family ABC transporter substrate-binding protein [Cloacibacillus sp.]